MQSKIIFSLVLGLLIGATVIMLQAPETTLGSVIPGGEYNATTTTDMAQVHNQITSDRITTLGQVNVASTSATSFTIWNATSTTDTASTSFATFKASVGEGTYTFDAVLERGLIVETPAGFNGSYQVMYRPQ